MAFSCTILCYLLICFTPLSLSHQGLGPEIVGNLEYVLDPNTTFNITCKGNVPLKWTRTQIITNINAEYSSKNESFNESTLMIENVTFKHTGEYKCHGENNDSYATSIYIYVRDLEHLSLIDDSPKNIITSTRHNVTLPCIPTFPDVNVTLLYDEEMIHDYCHPKTGCNVFVKDETFEDLYECVFEYNKIKQTLLLTVHQYLTFVYSPDVEIVGGNHTIVGNELKIKCTIYTQSLEIYNFSWTTPSGPFDKRRMKTQRLSDDDPQINIEELTIPVTSLELDNGYYTCTINDYQEHSESTSIFVKIFDQNEHSLVLADSSNKTIITEKIGNLVRWVYTVISHPKATVTWYNPHNKIIKDTIDHYKVSFLNDDAKLEIINITYNDYGKYVVEATNGIDTKRQTLFLNVTSLPIVEIVSNELHLLNKNVHVMCFVTASPFVTNVSIAFESEKNSTITNLISTSAQKLKKGYKVSILAAENGKIICEATNSLGSTQTNATFLVSDIENKLEVLNDFPQGIYFDKNAKSLTVARKHPLRITCASSIYFNTNEIVWYINEMVISNSNNIQITNENTKYSFRSILEIKSAENSAKYKCQAHGKNFIKNYEDTITVNVEEAKPPSFISKSLDIVETNMSYPFKFDCSVSGVPFPEIKWYKNEQLFKNKKNVLNDYNQVLALQKTELNDEGIYKCVAKNELGLIEKISSLKFKDKPKNEIPKAAIIAIGVLLVFVIVVCGLLFIKIRKEKKLQRELQNAGLANFEKGSPECVNPDLGLEDQAELLPYDKKWEFPIEKLKLGRQLGSGAFGVVLRGEAKGISLDEESTTVAVKMVKRNADNTYIKALASELKIMVHLGQHLNVVNLLGAITKHVGKRELMVIVEYCRYGNIQNYLLRHRETFVDQVDPSTGNIDYNIGLEEFERTRSVSSTPSSPPYLKYADLLLKQRSRLNSSTVSTNGEDIVMSSGSVQPDWRSNYHGDYKDGTIQPICTKDLLSWTFQVARGMEYLASRKVLHGDLAARNILLADNNIVKICDFGLAKTMYKDDNYKKKSDGPLPVKWMAIESIRDRVFSTQSDVWAFGVVLWEFFSLGKSPYPGMEADEKFYNKLLDGYRMQPPEYAPQNIAKMMSDCWLVRPNSRPSFTQLSERIGSMLEDSVRQHYIDLNDPYLMMNTQRIENGYNDYLAMFAPPNFDQLASPLDFNNETPSPPAYLDMTPAIIFSPRGEHGQIFDFNVTKEKGSKVNEMAEMMPMLTRSTSEQSERDHPSVVLNSIANPSYSLTPINETKKDIKCTNNYVNMPQNKINNWEANKDPEKLEHPYINDFPRDWEGVQV